jgi:hypothetical protein
MLRLWHCQYWNTARNFISATVPRVDLTYSTMIQLSETRDLRVSYIFQIPKESVVQENLYIQSTT